MKTKDMYDLGISLHDCLVSKNVVEQIKNKNKISDIVIDKN